MVDAAVVLLVEMLCGLAMLAVGRGAALLCQTAAKWSSMARSALIVAAHLVLLGFVGASFVAPVSLVESTGPSFVWWLLFCWAAFAVLPHAWLARNNPRWMPDVVPEWAKGEPEETIRAPWYTNWRSAPYVGAFFLGAIPFAVMGYTDQSVLEALWTSAQLAVLGTIGFLPFLVGFTFLFPLRVYRSGIRGFTESGTPVSVRWSEIAAIESSHSYGVQGLSMTCLDGKPDLWIPTTVADQSAFRNAIRRFVDAGHALPQSLGPRSAGSAV